MNFAERQLETAKKLIDKFGNDMTLNQYGTDIADIQAGGDGKVLSNTFTIKGTFTAYEAEEIRNNVQAGDIKAIVYYNEDITYEIDNNKVIVDDVPYTVKNVAPIKAQNQTIILELQLRR